MLPETLLFILVALVVVETDQTHPTFVLKRNDQPQAVEIASEDARFIKFQHTKLNLIMPAQLQQLMVNPLVEKLTTFLGDNTDGIILEPTSLTLVTTYAKALIDINDKVKTLKPDCYSKRTKRSPFQNAIISLLSKLGQELMGKALSKRTALTSLTSLLTRPKHLLTPQDKQGPVYEQTKVNALFRDIILSATSVANRLLDELRDVKATLREIKTPRDLKAILRNSSKLVPAAESLVAQPQTPWLKNFVTLKREGCVTTVSTPEAIPEHINVKTFVLLPSIFRRFEAPRTTYVHNETSMTCVRPDGGQGMLVCTPVPDADYLTPRRRKDDADNKNLMDYAEGKTHPKERKKSKWPKDKPPTATTTSPTNAPSPNTSYTTPLTLVNTMLTMGIIVTVIVLVVRAHLYNRKRSSNN